MLERVSRLTRGKRPSEIQDFCPSDRVRHRPALQYTTDFKARLSALEKDGRLYLMRHFIFENPHGLIAKHLQTEDEFSHEYEIACRKILSNAHKWKHQTINRFIGHLSNLYLESPTVQDSTDTSHLRTFLNRILSWENFEYRASEVIHFEFSPKSSKWFFKEVYVYFCIKTHLHLRDPNSP